MTTLKPFCTLQRQEEEMISIKNLWERDNGLCHICGKSVAQKRNRGNNPGRLAPTRDHVVPVVLGGRNSSDNLRLAHKICNEKRGALPVEEFQATGFVPIKKISQKEQERKKAAAERRAAREQIFARIQQGG